MPRDTSGTENKTKKQRSTPLNGSKQLRVLGGVRSVTKRLGKIESGTVRPVRTVAGMWVKRGFRLMGIGLFALQINWVSELLYSNCPLVEDQ